MLGLSWLTAENPIVDWLSRTLTLHANGPSTEAQGLQSDKDMSNSKDEFFNPHEPLVSESVDIANEPPCDAQASAYGPQDAAPCEASLEACDEDPPSSEESEMAEPAPHISMIEAAAFATLLQ